MTFIIHLLAIFLDEIEERWKKVKIVFQRLNEREKKIDGKNIDKHRKFISMENAIKIVEYYFGVKINELKNVGKIKFHILLEVIYDTWL